MDHLLLNILESAFTMALFSAFYKLFLEKETFFKLNRAYLLSTLIFSITIPYLSFDFFNDAFLVGNPFMQKVSEARNGYYELNEVIIYAYSSKFTWSDALFYLSAIYITGVVVSLVYFVVGFSRIFYLIFRSNSVKVGKFRIVETHDAIVPFSLFKWIIINPEKYTAKEMEQVIAHEKIHAFQLHSFDLIFVEVLVILFWFNPFIFWYRKSIREIHEYLADCAVVENGCDRVDYQKLLFSQVSGSRFIGLTSRFSYSLSKNRIKMLTMMKSKNSKKIKIALAMPVVIVAVLFFANPKDLVKASVHSSYSEKNIMANDDTLKSDESVYFHAEKMPKFQGQESDAFRSFIQQNLKYPEEAAKQKIEGKVFVSFTVDQEGNVKDVEVARSANPILDEEAVRVTELSPKWEPAEDKGEKVSVRFTFPITFAIKKEK